MSAYFRPIAVFIILVLSGCAGLPRNFDKLQEPQVSLAGLALKDANPLKPRFLVRLRVENPNDLEVKLDGAEVALALNGQPIARGLGHGPLSLAKRGASDLDVEVAADTLGIIQQFLALQSKSALDYEVSGHLAVLDWLGPLGRIPFDFKGTLNAESLWRGAESLGTLAVPAIHTAR